MITVKSSLHMLKQANLCKHFPCLRILQGIAGKAFLSRPSSVIIHQLGQTAMPAKKSKK